MLPAGNSRQPTYIYLFVSIYTYIPTYIYYNINNQLDAIIIIIIIIFFNQLNMFRAIISPILRSTRLWYNAAPLVHYTTRCKHSLVLLRMDEIIARNMLS